MKFVSKVLVSLSILLLLMNTSFADIRHIVIFKYKPGVSPEKKREIARRFLELKSLAKKDGKNYIVSIVGGKATSREGFDQGLEEAFVVTFRSEADRDYFVGKPYSSVMDPAHADLAGVVEPLLSVDSSGRLNGLFVFDFDDATS